MLIVFAGLPGTGKTTLAHGLAMKLGATYLRIDTIEQALRRSGKATGDVGPAGYMVAQALAETNLCLGRIVIADAVNPIAAAREAWRGTAAAAGCGILEIEVICSDPVEHRRRVETRESDIAGLAPPTWQQAIARHYEPWDQPHFVLDTAGRNPAEMVDALRARIGRP